MFCIANSEKNKINLKLQINLKDRQFDFHIR